MNRPQIACLSLLLFLPVPAFAQQSNVPAPSAPQAPALTARPAPAPDHGQGRMQLDVVVTDKSGKPVSGLEPADFTLLDDKLPAKILSLHAVEATNQPADPPAEAILLIDAVNLPFQQVAIERQGIEKFLRENGGRLAVPVAIDLFTDEGVKVRIKHSSDGNALAANLSQVDAGLRVIGRSAGAAGATERFNDSIRIFTALAKNYAQLPGKKLLIWVGPGWPMLDGVNFYMSNKEQQMLFDRIVELSTILRQGRISVYSISTAEFAGPTSNAYLGFLKSVNAAAKSNPGNLDLKVLVVQSGGRVLLGNDLSSQIDSCVQDAGAFYTLSFDPPRADRQNEYHDLKVQIDKLGIAARTSTGYYNQP
ncbi:MAG: VWA domain-containing protein [Terracidiphilus sp.]|jgi:VWFA-related protein